MGPVEKGKRLLAAALIGAVALAPSGCLTTKSVANKATFGLVGDKQKIADEKAEKKQHEQEKKQEKKDREQKAYADKQARKRAREEAKAQQKADEKAARDAKKQAKNESKPVAGEKVAEAEPETTKRSFWNKATFGLIGSSGAKAKESDQESEEKSPSKEEKRAAKDAKKQEARDRKDAEKQAKQDKKAQKKQAEADRKQAKKEEKAAKKAEKSDAQQPEEASTAAEQPKQKRTLLSRATFGLVGGKKVEKNEKEETEKSAPLENATSDTKEAAPVKTAKATEPAVTTPEEPKTPIPGEHRGIAHATFHTEVMTVGQTASGLPKVEVSRRTYSQSGYGITDLGDVRIAVKGMTFPGETRAAGVVVQSDERGVAAGKSGKGNESFAFEYGKGVTNCTFGKIKFTISKGVLNIDGHDVPIGKGRRLVVVDENGKVAAVYNIGG